MSEALNEQVNFKTLVRVAPERAYDALATGAGLDEWFTTGATVDARPGGVMHFRWQDWGLDRYTGENRGTVLEARRPARFVFQWKADSGTYRTTVEIDFEPAPEGTIVRLIEHGYQATPAGRTCSIASLAGRRC